jgi:hypothetical protein
VAAGQLMRHRFTGAPATSPSAVRTALIFKSCCSK